MDRLLAHMTENGVAITEDVFYYRFENCLAARNEKQFIHCLHEMCAACPIAEKEETLSVLNEFTQLCSQNESIEPQVSPLAHAALRHRRFRRMHSLRKADAAHHSPHGREAGAGERDRACDSAAFGFCASEM